VKLRFEWNPAKASANVAKHGVTFDDARDVFNDPLAKSIPDAAHASDEARFWTMGQSRVGRVLVVVHTDRGDTIRIIGARRATARERHDYEEDQTRRRR